MMNPSDKANQKFKERDVSSRVKRRNAVLGTRIFARIKRSIGILVVLWIIN